MAVGGALGAFDGAAPPVQQAQTRRFDPLGVAPQL